MTDAELLARTLNAKLDRDIADLLADGLVDPVEIAGALLERPEWANAGFSQVAVERRVKLLLRDTRETARMIVRAKSSEMMQDIIASGDVAQLLRALEKWGPEVNSEHVEHKGEMITRHVVELHDGPPPKMS